MRLTITLSEAVHQALLQLSRSEGRSLSNLAAHLLANAVEPAAAEAQLREDPGPAQRREPPAAAAKVSRGSAAGTQR